MELKEGYKQSDIGEIPIDWNATSISTILEKGTRITYGVVQPGKDVRDGVLFIRGGDIFKGKIDIGNLRKISHRISKKYNRTLLEGGEILISLVGYPGEAAIVPDKLAGANIARQVALVKINKNKDIDVEYLCYFLLSDTGKKILLKEMIGSAQQVINLQDLNKLVVPVPKTKSEQLKIAIVLSDVDAYIESLEQLIEKKRQIKEGAMQELLTGKLRLPGYKYEWKRKKLGEIIEEISDGGTPSTSNMSYFGGPINWAVIEDIKDEITSTRSTLTQKGLHACSAQLWPAGSLIISTGATIGEVGITKVPLATKQGICGIITNESYVIPAFLKYWFIGNRKNLLSQAQGSTIKEVRPPLLIQLSILLPRIEEQKDIVEILTNMDSEINILKYKLVKVKNIKQGMMQELLTGRIRLI